MWQLIWLATAMVDTFETSHKGQAVKNGLFILQLEYYCLEPPRGFEPRTYSLRINGYTKQGLFLLTRNHHLKKSTE